MSWFCCFLEKDILTIYNHIRLFNFILIMNHSMKLLKNPYDRISNGKKIIELRLFDEKRQKINIGDTIEFSKLPDLQDTINVKVTALLRYASFEDLIYDFGMEYFGYPKNYSINNFMSNIYKIYPKEKERKYGVLGIKIEVLK